MTDRIVGAINDLIDGWLWIMDRWYRVATLYGVIVTLLLVASDDGADLVFACLVTLVGILSTLTAWWGLGDDDEND